MRIRHAYSSGVGSDQLVTTLMIEGTTARTATQREPPHGGPERRPVSSSSSYTTGTHLIFKSEQFCIHMISARFWGIT